MDSRSDTLFEKLFESSPDAILVADRQGRITRVNAQLETMFGYLREELVGQPVELLVPERLRSAHALHREGYYAEPRMRPMGAGLQLVARRKDGSEFPADIMLSPMNSEEGLLVLGVIRDITERRRAEEELRESQAMLERLFESSPDAILLLTSLEGRMVRVNSQAEKMSGYRRDELIGQPVEALIAPRSRDPHWPGRLTYRAEAREQTADAAIELWAKRKHGEEFPAEVSLSPVQTREGELVLATVRDVTRRKRAEEALRESEEVFRSLVEGVKDYAIFMLDPEGRVASWNLGAERIQGYKAEEIIGRHFSSFHTQEDIERGKPEQELKIAAAQGRYEDEGWRVRRDGSRFWANVVITALRDESGRLRGFSKVTRDFTERKRAQEALLLEISNVLVSNLDIRKLLAAISASLQQVTSHEYACLALYDRESKKLRLQVLASPPGKDSACLDTALPLENSPAGQAFTTREPVVLNRMERDRFAPEIIQQWVELGVQSACFLPLISHGAPLGSLIVASEREAAFKERDVHLLSQIANQVAVALDNALAYRNIAELTERLKEEKTYLEEELRTEYNFEEIVGQSPGLKHVLKQVETVGPTDATALILGETGTGKELIARAIHNLSPRRERTFVKLNCAALPSGLVESELFGHERGAFTGAIAQKIGRLELAHEGTLFLDEIGDIPLELQPKLLRALQEKEFERLGSTRTIPVDVRLIAATNRDLEQMIRNHQFRTDLYYRLKVFPIRIPPLRERAEDIPVLVHYFVQKHAKRMNRRIETVPPEVMEAMKRWSWPGNVREIENFLERAVILSRGPVLRVPLSELQLTPETNAAAPSTLETTEREHILRVLRETNGLIGGPHGAAARLGLKRTTLNFKMKKLGITRDSL